MSSIQELYNTARTLYDTQVYDYAKNTDALLILLELTSQTQDRGLCYDTSLRKGKKTDIFTPEFVQKVANTNCKNILYAYQNTIRTFNIMTDIIQTRRTQSNNSNVIVQTVQINDINIQGGEVICCASAIAEPEKYGDCTDTIVQNSDVSVKVTNNALTQSEKEFIIQKFIESLTADFIAGIDRSGCTDDSIKQQTKNSIVTQANLSQPIQVQFTKITQINREDIVFQRIWAWGPCFDLKQENKIDIDIILTKSIVNNILQEIFNQFQSNNSQFQQFMKLDDTHLEECSVECLDDQNFPNCTTTTEYRPCEGKTDGMECTLCDPRNTECTETQVYPKTCQQGICKETQEQPCEDPSQCENFCQRFPQDPKCTTNPPPTTSSSIPTWVIVVIIVAVVIFVAVFVIVKIYNAKKASSTMVEEAFF